MKEMLRRLAKMFGGGMIGMLFAGVVLAFLLILIIAAIVALVIFPLFFLGLFFGAAVSAEFYKFLYAKTKNRTGMTISEGTKVLFRYDMRDFLDSFGWRRGEVEQLREQCRVKEKEATEAVMRIERGIQSLEDTWKMLIDKYTIKESIMAPRAIMSERIKKAALTTFKDPSFARLSEEIENESIRFENFLV
jgi:hypothetical protein